MPTNATLCSVYRGINPPINPAENTLWYSQSIGDISISDSPADRTLVLSPSSSGFEANVVQEANVFWNPVLNNWGMLYGGVASCGYATATNPLGPWTKFSATAVLGNGNGGQTNQALHGRVYIEGSTIYYTFADPTTNKIKVATASLATPQTFTTIGNLMSLPNQISSFGNSILVKRAANDYLLFFEGLFTSSGYQMGIATGTSPTGAFLPISLAMPTLWNGFTSDSTSGIGGWTGSGPRPFIENGKYILYFHTAALGSVSSEIYRAVSTDANSWTIDNNGFPIVRRRLPLEASQVADICITQGPNGGYWSFWEGYENVTNTSSIYCSPCLEPLKRWDGAVWAPIGKVPGPQFSDFNSSAYIFTGAHTAQNLDDIAVDATAGAVTITLPRADAGSRVRVNNVGTVNNVTVSAAGGDTITIGAIAVVPGGSNELRCYVANRWVKL